jgi:hypothetical protein
MKVVVIEGMEKICVIEIVGRKVGMRGLDCLIRVAMPETEGRCYR